MANLGNAWHIPNHPELRGRGTMRDPIGAIVPGATITLFSGNQFQGPGGNPGNQLQTGSSVFFKQAADVAWTELPMRFFRTANKNKYYSTTINADISSTFQVADVIQYYLRITYDDHDTTFLHANADGSASTPTDSEAAAQAAPFTFTLESSARWGLWGPVLQFPNVPIHTHVLPNGRVLMWGRRDTANLDDHVCTPFVWNPTDATDPADPTRAKTANTNPKQLQVNLFCSGHAFLPDGRLLVAGGHLSDSGGINQAIIYDSASNEWTPTAKMNKGRWYPTATTLPDGGVLVLAGSYKEKKQGKEEVVHNTISQVWRDGVWTPTATFPDKNGELELYPRMHVASDGRVFMSGPLEKTYLLKTSNGSQWTPVAPRALKQRDYCPAVMYDVDKVIYIGGGHDPDGTQRPTCKVEIIDLQEAVPQWRKTNPMKFRRRQHNAAILPDGTILVTGGTRGGGDPDDGFNDVAPGQPVHVAELWDPATEAWTELAAEGVDRCYHATAVLLPDATVLSAGGGEYRPDGKENPPEDTHRNGQVFSPPYLFKGPRPVIMSAPSQVDYGESFQVGTAQPDQIGKVSWVRLPSVTHSFDESQRINFLQFQADAGRLTVTAPASANLCPPGHYMLFILSNDGVPSAARIIQIQAAVPQPLAAHGPAAALEPESSAVGLVASEFGAYLDPFARRDAVAEAARGTAVVIGITGTCPYGIGACWGGACEALNDLEGVDLVDPIPDADNSTARVFLQDDRLPPLDRWDEQFRSTVNGRYRLRGFEAALKGAVENRDGSVFLGGSGQRPPVHLAPLTAAERIQWDQAARTLKPLEQEEASAYYRLAAASVNLPDGQQVTVTGPLKQTDAGYLLHVRLFEV